MKNFFIALLLLGSVNAFGQQTNSFIISGKVKKESTITPDSLLQYKVNAIGEFTVTNHTGAFKHKDDQLKGVLLKDILSNTVFDASGPKVLSELYFICTAADGYKVVYSWNELYNTETGNHVFIVTEKNGKKLADMTESIQMVSGADFKTGRRYLHNLSKITVARAE